MNIEAITLKLLLTEPDKEKALEIFSRLRKDYFNTAFKPIFSHIKDFYANVGTIPSLAELQTATYRDKKAKIALSTLELIKAESIDVEVAIEALEDEFTQNNVIKELKDYIASLTLMDRHEIVSKLSAIPLKLEEDMQVSNSVYSARDFHVFRKPEEFKKVQVPSGISDEWDREAGGYYRQELVLLGGKKGSGKSIVCANLVANQHKQGKVSMYFTIEMTAEETFLRIICILADVEFSHYKKDELTLDDKRKLGKTMASLFVGGEEVFDKYFTNNIAPDIFSFQEELTSKCKEKDYGRIIIVDDRSLSTATVDTKVALFKSRYGEDLALVAIDYLNQLTIDGDEVDMYDWKAQTVISKTLKNLTRKHDICIVSPYQMDENGQARFAKGILDAPDVAQIIQVEDKDGEQPYLVFETVKARSTKDSGKHRVRIDWTTLTIDPRPVAIEELQKKDRDEKAGTEQSMDLL